jgi:NADH-quinone oxidoreductase subunit N
MALLLALGDQLGLQGGVLPGLERLLLLVATLNLAWGSVGALHQTSLRRLLVHSSMANLSLPLYALAAAGGGSSPSALLYLLLYLATTATLLLPLLATAGVGQRWCLVELSRGVDGSLRTLLTLAILNMSGVPPFALFFAKLPIALELVERGFYLSLLMLLGFSVVGVAYAFQLLVHLWLRGQTAMGSTTSTPTTFSLLPLLLGLLYLNLGRPPTAAVGAEAGMRLPLVDLTHADFSL